jgi:hypothetical protein
MLQFPRMVRKTGKGAPVAKEPGFPDNNGINETLTDLLR